LKRWNGTTFRACPAAFSSDRSSYAQEIGADPATTVREFIASFPEDAANDTSSSRPIDYEKATTPRRGARGVILVSIALIALVVIVLWLQFGME